jgi:2-oxo-4-hydroxy-4-carboxy--5-ureidoimidazoline (OHCU) decarboxylase
MEIAALDAMPKAEFIAAVAPLFEGAPHFLDRLATARPLGDANELFRRATAIAISMPESEQIELIDAHPRLGAPPESVSALSYREQGYDIETTEAIADLDRLNALYEAKFGFRFCVFVAGRSRQELVPVLEAALQAERVAEIQRALGDVVAIARDRYRMLAASTQEGVL